MSFIYLLSFVFLLLQFLYMKEKIRYFLKFTIYYGIVMVLAVVLIPFFLVRPKNVKNLIIASFLCKHIAKIIGVRYSIGGDVQNLIDDECCIIVSNHQSSLDILGMFNLWETMGKCTVVAKKELFYFWPFGLAAYLCNLIFIPRFNTDKSRQILESSLEVLRENRTKLWIFPEGTRRNTGHIHDFKKGAFHLACTAKIPILPIVFSEYYFMDKKKRRFGPGRVRMEVLPKINTENVESVDELIATTREKMVAKFKEINTRI